MGTGTERGTVKWFNDAKGFGFINHSNGEDVFVHFSVIESEGFKTLKDGEVVEYELTQGPKGLNATRVVRLSPPQPSDSASLKSLASQVEVISTENAMEETSVSEISVSEISVSEISDDLTANVIAIREMTIEGDKGLLS